MSELNKQKVRLFVEVVLNEGRLELIDELLAADYLGRIPCAPGQVVGRDELRRLVLDHRLIHPGLCIKIEEEIAEDDLVMMRWRSGATAPGRTAMGGSPQCWLGISVIRLLAGRQVDAYTAIAASATQAAPCSGDAGFMLVAAILATGQPVGPPGGDRDVAAPAPKRLILGYLLRAYATSIAAGLAIDFSLHGSRGTGTSTHTLGPSGDMTLASGYRAISDGRSELNSVRLVPA